MSQVDDAQRAPHDHWHPVVTLRPPPNAVESRFDVFLFSPTDPVEHKCLEDIEWLLDNRDKYSTIWLNVEGLANVELLARLGEAFGLHRLSLEDVLATSQRPKYESYQGYHFLVLKMLRLTNQYLESEQLCVFLGHGFVLTFQEGLPGDCLDSLRSRLRVETKTRHDNLASFIHYSIIDAVVDSYFPLLEAMGERLEELEEQILFAPNPDCMRTIHDAKRDLLTVRRAVWPLREALSPLFHDDSGLVCSETKLFLRDCHDHCIQVIDVVETYREVSSSLMDVYLSSISHRMNEVMKVLTVITTIFVPLTFVAGVYGMNFDPISSPLNMPELNAYWGYPVCLCAMVLIALSELWFFKKAGWILKSGSRAARGENGRRETITSESKSGLPGPSP